MNIRLHIFSFVSILFVFACANLNETQPKNAISNATQPKLTSIKSGSQSTMAKANNDSQTAVKLADNQLMISFDNIKPAEISANNNSNDGKNRKLPFIFEENGLKIKLSNLFYLDSAYGKKNPVSSPPYSMSGVNSFLTINDDSSFSVQSAMVGGLKQPSKLKLIGYKDGEVKYKKTIEIDYPNLREVNLDFEDIDNLSMQAILGESGVMDDIIISLF